MKIGLLIDDCNTAWVDGADQAAYFVFSILKNIGYNVVLVSFYTKKEFFNEHVVIESYSNIKNYDLFLNLSKYNQSDAIRAVMAKGVKIATYIHHNFSMNMIESIINKDVADKMSKINWRNYCPNIITTDTNLEMKSYLEIISDSNVLIAPFLWSPKFIIENKNFEKLSDIKLENINFGKIGILESNYNFYKNSIISLSIAEALNKEIGEKIKTLYVGNLESKLESKMLKSYLDGLSIHKQNKTIFYRRMPTPYLVANDIFNLLITNSFNNENNFYHYEMTFLKRPFVHNCNKIKSYGIYYNDMDISDAKDKIIELIKSNNAESNLSMLDLASINSDKNKIMFETLIGGIK